MKEWRLDAKEEQPRRARAIAALEPDEALISFCHGDGSVRYVKVPEGGLEEAMARCNREFGEVRDLGGPPEIAALHSDWAWGEIPAARPKRKREGRE